MFYKFSVNTTNNKNLIETSLKYRIEFAFIILQIRKLFIKNRHKYNLKMYLFLKKSEGG